MLQSVSFVVVGVFGVLVFGNAYWMAPFACILGDMHPVCPDVLRGTDSQTHSPYKSMRLRHIGTERHPMSHAIRTLCTPLNSLRQRQFMYADLSAARRKDRSTLTDCAVYMKFMLNLNMSVALLHVFLALYIFSFVFIQFDGVHIL